MRLRGGDPFDCHERDVPTLVLLLYGKTRARETFTYVFSRSRRFCGDINRGMMRRGIEKKVPSSD
jgi:hypothetical protein